jgi:hypothetical protein
MFGSRKFLKLERAELIIAYIQAFGCWPIVNAMISFNEVSV